LFIIQQFHKRLKESIWLKEKWNKRHDRINLTIIIGKRNKILSTSINNVLDFTVTFRNGKLSSRIWSKTLSDSFFNGVKQQLNGKHVWHLNQPLLEQRTRNLYEEEYSTHGTGAETNWRSLEYFYKLNIYNIHWNLYLFIKINNLSIQHYSSI
jgi:hypothetical protein